MYGMRVSTDRFDLDGSASMRKTDIRKNAYECAIEYKTIIDEKGFKTQYADSDFGFGDRSSYE